MSKHKIIFYGSDVSETDMIELTCHVNADNEIFIKIKDRDFPISFICLDKSTAIKFAKTLRTEINKIKED